jgi:hypothetical protein
LSRTILVPLSPVIALWIVLRVRFVILPAACGGEKRRH